ncbi:MAG: glycosyltransferase, partial [Flavobacterium sp.]
SERVRRELGFAHDDFVIGTAVVLSEQKGIRYLIEAAKRVCAELPKARFVVAGDGPLRGALEDMGRASGLGERLTFLGFRRDIPELISSFDVYALSSLWEGLPLALLEALAIGKPIVATRVGGNPEIVEDGENGFIVPPRDADALARALVRVALDDGFRARVRAANVAKFAARFSLEAMLRGHAETYADVVGRASSRAS